MDVTFLIGHEPFTERVEVSSQALCSHSPVFRAMLTGPMAEVNSVICIQDIEPRAFDIIVSFMNGDAIRFKSVFTALAVIYAADKYMVKKIDILALKFIRKNLTVNDSLMILQHLYFLHGDENGCDDHIVQDMEPSAPTLEALESPEAEPSPNRKEFDINGRHFLRLHHEERIKVIKSVEEKCFSVIDKHASHVLESDEFEDISLELLKHIIARDSLQIQSELIILDAVDRWSHRQCRRRHMAITAENKRFVLGDARFLIRYLTFTSDQFKIGQERSKLLTKEEEINLLFSILHLGTSMTPELEAHRCRMQRRRRSVPCLPWYTRLWSAKRPVIRDPANTKETELCGKEKISFMEIMFVLIGQILD